MGRRNVKRVTDESNNTQKAEIYALDAQGNVMAVYEINKDGAQYALSCKERMLYGSSRLGILKKKITFENKSATDMSQMENSVFEFLNPSHATSNEAFTADKKQKIWSGLKEYELNNHLGNVLATVSDRKLGRTSDVQNSQLQRYRPELRMSTEYYPFGSMLENWGCTSAIECTQYSYLYADSLVTDHFTTGTVQDLIVEPYYGYDANNTTMSILSEANGNKYLQYNAAYIHQPILRSIPNLQHGKSYTLKIRGKVASGNAQITIRRYNKANPANYGNATSKVINLYNNTWLSDSVVFTVDSAWRYVVHIRNTNYGASSIHIDDVRVYGKNTASYLLCGSGGEGYRFGFNSMSKENELYGSEGNAYDFGARIYDSRLGRFLSVDPLAEKYTDNSPYNFVGNSPILLLDGDGREWVNPYKEKYEKAKIDLRNAQNTYNDLIKNNPQATASEIRKFKKASNLNSLQMEFEEVQSDYQEVEDYLYTFKITNRKEYDRIDKLEDVDPAGNVSPIKVFVELNNGPNPDGSSVSVVDGLATYSGTYIPTASNLTLTIKLFNSGSDLEYFSGRNYRSFTNEVGDILYYFDNVKDKESFNKWENSASSGMPGYKNDPTGAGVKSEEYSNNRLKDVKNYVNDGLQKGETYNSTKHTIEKRDGN